MKFKITGDVEFMDDGNDDSDILELIIDYKGRSIPAWVKIDIENEQKRKKNEIR